MGEPKSTTRKWSWRFPVIMVVIAYLVAGGALVECIILDNRLAIIEEERRENPNSFGPTTQPMVAGLEVVKKVDAFYQSAWTLLVAAFALGGVIIGVLVPYVMQRLQVESFAEKLAESKKMADARIIEALNTVAEQQKAESEEAAKQLRQEFNREVLKVKEELSWQAAFVGGDVIWSGIHFSHCLDSVAHSAKLGRTKVVEIKLNLVISKLERGAYRRLLVGKKLISNSLSLARAAIIKASMPEGVMEQFDKADTLMQCAMAADAEGEDDAEEPKDEEEEQQEAP